MSDYMYVGCVTRNMSLYRSILLNVSFGIGCLDFTSAHLFFRGEIQSRFFPLAVEVWLHVGASKSAWCWYADDGDASI